MMRSIIGASSEKVYPKPAAAPLSPLLLSHLCHELSRRRVTDGFIQLYCASPVLGSRESAAALTQGPLDQHPYPPNIGPSWSCFPCRCISMQTQPSSLTIWVRHGRIDAVHRKKRIGYRLLSTVYACAAVGPVTPLSLVWKASPRDDDWDLLVQGYRGRMVKASGWRSFDRQFEPYPRAIKAAPLWCSLGCRSKSDGIIHQ